MKLCKNGQLNQGLKLMHECNLNCPSFKLGHIHLSLLLEACIKARKPEKYRSIWNKFINQYKIRPNHISYCLAAHAAAKCNDIRQLTSIINQMFGSIDKNVFDIKTYNSLIHSLTLTNPIDIDLIFDIYINKMIDPDHYTLSSLFNACIKSKRCDKFEYLLSNILNQCNNDHIDNVALIAIINGLIKFNKCHLFEELWNKIAVEPNVNCYGMAIIASSYSKNTELLNKLVMEIKHKYHHNITVNHWNQIFVAYSNLLNYKSMWNEYKSMSELYGATPNIKTLNILVSVNNKEYKQLALNEIKQYIKKYGKKVWYDLEYEKLKRFYIEANYCKDIELISILEPIVNKKSSIDKNVIAKVISSIDNVCYSFDNLIKFEDENVLKLVDDLLKEINFNDSLSPYHAEKKALAFILDRYKGDHNLMDVSIEVNFRICRDCHKFFLCVSDYYPSKIIKVNDSRKIHTFCNGKCSCGAY